MSGPYPMTTPQIHRLQVELGAVRATACPGCGRAGLPIAEYPHYGAERCKACEAAHGLQMNNHYRVPRRAA